MNPRLLLALLLALAVLLLPAVPAASGAPLRTAPALVRISGLDVEAEPPNAASATSSAPPKITARVAVMETTGVPVRGLAPDAFAVTEDGKPAKNVAVESAASSNEPLAVVLALDTSGSMAIPSIQPLRDMQHAARTFLDGLGPSDTVAAFGFGGAVPQGLAWNPDRHAVYDTINALRGDGITPLWDAVFAAVTLAADQPAGRRAVLVMSDGEDEGDRPGTPGSVKTLDDAITLAQQRNTPVFAVALGRGRTAGLQRLAETTGGVFLPAAVSSELPARFADVASAFRQEYLIHFEGEGRNAESERELAITVNLRGEPASASRRYSVPHTIARRVAVRITTPSDGQQVRGAVPVEVAITPAESGRTVEFFLNDLPIGTAAAAPWAATWTPKGMKNGDKILRVRATGVDGVAVEQVITVRLMQPARPVPWGIGLGGALLAIGAIGAAIALGLRRRSGSPAMAGVRSGAVTVAPVWEPAREPVPAGGGGWSAGPSYLLIEIRPDGARIPRPLTPPETLIGREVSSPHVLLDDPDVSRLHGVIRIGDGQATYEEFSPTNPAQINGRPYAGPHPLAIDDEIQIGQTRLIYRETGNG